MLSSFFSLYALSQSTCEPSAEAVEGLNMLQMNKYSQANTQHVSLRLCVGHAMEIITRGQKKVKVLHLLVFVENCS